MFTQRIVAAVAVVVLTTSASATSQTNRIELATREELALNQAATEFLQGDSLGVLQALSPVVQGLSDDKVKAANEFLRQRQVPSGVAELLAESRLALAQQGLAQAAPQAGPREAALVLKTLRSQITFVQEQAAQIAKNQGERVPLNFKSFEAALWHNHVLQNRLLSARRVAEYARQMADAVPKAQRERLDGEDRVAVDANYPALIAALEIAASDAEEQEIDLRVERLSLARDVLEEEELTKQRITAAFTANLDGRVVAQFLDQADKTGRVIRRQKLRESGLRDRVSQLAAESRDRAGPLAEKSKLLFEGLHWWMRGRYGMGPDADGLAKSTAVTRVPDAQFWLYMPTATPKPTNPAVFRSTEPVPFYDRRHLHWWALEDRRVRRQSGMNTQTTSKFAGEFYMQTSRFW